MSAFIPVSSRRTLASMSTLRQSANRAFDSLMRHADSLLDRAASNRSHPAAKGLVAAARQSLDRAAAYVDMGDQWRLAEWALMRDAIDAYSRRIATYR